jgi:hypothetical protein
VIQSPNPDILPVADLAQVLKTADGRQVFAFALLASKRMPSSEVAITLNGSFVVAANPSDAFGKAVLIGERLYPGHTLTVKILNTKRDCILDDPENVVIHGEGTCSTSV